MKMKIKMEIDQIDKALVNLSPDMDTNIINIEVTQHDDAYM